MVLRKILLLLISVFILSGCTTYKFQKSTSGSQGYLACYDGYPIAEYTMGKEKSLPELILAKERFKRRRLTVEYYYKQMRQIESRCKAFLWEPPAMAASFLSGVVRWPFIAMADYKYNHNPKYKAKVDRLDEENEALESSRVASLRKKLDDYIAKDLAKESLMHGAAGSPTIDLKPEPKASPVAQEVSVLPVVQEVTPQITTSLVNPQKTPEPSVVPETKEEPVVKLPAEPVVAVQPALEVKPVVAEAPTAKNILEPPVAVIVAQPVKGYSPLKVNFSGQKSHSKSGKIISYLWDFGDGDVSAQKNPNNTFWSTTFGSRSFTVTLTVRDQAGSVSSTTSVIEVITR